MSSLSVSCVLRVCVRVVNFSCFLVNFESMWTPVQLHSLTVFSSCFDLYTLHLFPKVFFLLLTVFPTILSRAILSHWATKPKSNCCVHSQGCDGLQTSWGEKLVDFVVYPAQHCCRSKVATLCTWAIDSLLYGCLQSIGWIQHGGVRNWIDLAGQRSQFDPAHSNHLFFEIDSRDSMPKNAVAARCLTYTDHPISSDWEDWEGICCTETFCSRNLGEPDLKPMTPCKDEWLGLVDVIPYSFQLFTMPNNLYNCTTELLQYNYIIQHRCQCCAFCFHAELQFCSILSHFFRGRREWKKLLCSQRATIPVMHLLKWGSMGAFGKGCFLRLLSVSCKPVLECWNKIEHEKDMWATAT